MNTNNTDNQKASAPPDKSAHRKTLDDLTRDERTAALEHFRAAVRARIRQWDHERAIENLLSGEVELNIANVAACCDYPETLSLNDLEECLQ